MPTPLIDYADLSPARRAVLEALVGGQTLLAHAITWAGPTAVEAIVTQDEYTHDVLIPYERDLYLVYDST